MMKSTPERYRWTALFAVAVVAMGLLACSPKKEAAPPAGAPPAATSTTDPSTPVARIGDVVITDGELRSEVEREIKAIEAQVYGVKKEGLDRLIDKRLIEAEAKKRNVSSDALIAKEVTSRVAPVSDEDAKKFYEENKGRISGQYEPLKERIKQYLTERNRKQAQDAFMKTLRSEAKVAILLEPPRIDIPVEGSPTRGEPDAPIVIVEFSDFECPFCRRSQDTLKVLKQKYPTQIKWVFKDFPLSFHARAMPAAIASRCAGEQGKYWEYHDKLFSGAGLQETDLDRYAKEIGLDTAKFAECVKSDRFKQSVNADMELGQSVGVTGTPAFFVNGRMLSGAVPPEAFVEIIDDELARKNAS
jgi:protein-disulfide isomerase